MESNKTVRTSGVRSPKGIYTLDSMEKRLVAFKCFMDMENSCNASPSTESQPVF
jgi:hypothetical protein